MHRDRRPDLKSKRRPFTSFCFVRFFMFFLFVPVFCFPRQGSCRSSSRPSPLHFGVGVQDRRESTVCGSPKPAAICGSPKPTCSSCGKPACSSCGKPACSSCGKSAADSTQSTFPWIQSTYGPHTIVHIPWSTYHRKCIDSVHLSVVWKQLQPRLQGLAESCALS